MVFNDYDIEPVFDADTFSEAPVIIAGPCSAESREQVLETARGLAAAGVKAFRAGVWKPRTKPGSFEGVGEEALAWLAEVKELTGMLTATEVGSRRHVEAALAAGVDILWIGARTTVNPFAVQEIADAFAELPAERRDSLRVLVKNPVNPDLELWIGAIERLARAGVRRLGAIHRGFSSYGENVYRNAPQWRLPFEFRRRLPGVTLLCDPSHIAGRSELVAPLARRAMAMDFDGLIIEAHCRPAEALSDAAQQLTVDELSQLVATLTVPDVNVPTDDALEALRRRIDGLDDALLELLSKRMAVAREIGRVKQGRNMGVVQPMRYNELLRRRLEEADSLGLDADFVKTLLQTVHEESVRQQFDAGK